MTGVQQHIMEIIEAELNKSPYLRFGQVLFNLDINQFADEINPENKNHLLRDIYNDQDIRILKRITEQQNKTINNNDKS